MRHSSKQFTWLPETRRFIAEVSELGANPFGQIYPDACDMGFVMISAVTGKESKWVEDSQIYDGDELAGWRFVPTDETVRKLPILKGVVVEILND